MTVIVGVYKRIGLWYIYNIIQNGEDIGAVDGKLPKAVDSNYYPNNIETEVHLQHANKFPEIHKRSQTKISKRTSYLLHKINFINIGRFKWLLIDNILIKTMRRYEIVCE